MQLSEGWQMSEIELLAHIIKWRDELSADVRVLKSDADIFVRPSVIRILLSLLLREGYLKNSDNDEVVLEMELNRATLQSRVDVSDSLGRYYYLEENAKIADEAGLASLSVYIQQAADELCVGGSSK
ncbi:MULTISPECIES: hypothetical protein [unclassified Eikenella]|uniref:hypothetical protein n=1 Tax=unclassified Eikenella TaxID=2639367 RepID=UPI0012E954A9|nr:MULTISPECIES: hypothetical protein [unclassified Eikenella]